MPALIGLIAAWSIASIALPFVRGSYWLVLPVTGALIWRFEHTRVRDIATWTIPLALVLLLAERLPDPLGLLVSLAGVVFLAAMMFSNTVRDGWLGIVAQGQYRVFHGEDRVVAERLAVLDAEAFDAIERYTRTGDAQESSARLDKLAADATALLIDDPAWHEVRSRLCDWLRASADAATASPERYDAAFARMEERRTAFDHAKAAIADARSVPVGRTGPTGPRT
jgi:hypothetical protein